MSCRLSVIVPCYNEAGNLPELVDRIQAVFVKRELSGEILLVNDASKDETGGVIDHLAREHLNVVPLHHATNQGLAQGWKTGFAASTGEYVCVIDADLQYFPEDIWRLYRELIDSRADLAQGVRSHIGRPRESRFIFSVGLNVMLNGLFRMRSRDNKSGFVVCRREVFENILRHRYRYRYFQTFIAVAAHAKGYTIKEVETLFESRLLGKSFLSSFPAKVIAGCLVDLAKGFVEYRVAPERDQNLASFVRKHPPSRQDPPLPRSRERLFRFYVATTPLHKWMITERFGGYLEDLRKTQWLDPAQMRELQADKLRSLIHLAYNRVSYYRQQMDARGLKPSDIRGPEDLVKLPLLSKDDVRNNLYFDLMAEGFDKRKILRITTSGSTGEPFTCFADQHQLEIRLASTLRSMEWTGYRFGDRQARLWHQTIGMSGSQIYRERLDAWLCRRIFIPAFEMTDDSLRKFMEQVAAWDPYLVDGYAESFNFLAHYLKSRGLPPFKPKAMISSAQQLPEASRAVIEEMFGCKVYDKYGSREFSGIAYECGHEPGNHHIVADSYIVEILKDGRPAQPGETGEVVITDLNNTCVPFIRYRVGDLAVALDPAQVCPCGRGLPRIGRIEGRAQSIVVGDGCYLPASFFLHLFKDYEHLIRKFQVVQEDWGRIRLKLIKGPRFDNEALQEVLRELSGYLGKQVSLEVEFVESIPLGRTGKHAAVVSQVSMDFQGVGVDRAPIR